MTDPYVSGDVAVYKPDQVFSCIPPSQSTLPQKNELAPQSILHRGKFVYQRQIEFFLRVRMRIHIQLGHEDL